MNCTEQCNSVQAQVDACKSSIPCYCTTAIAQGLETCADCKLEADPSAAYGLQAMLNQYANGCQANGQNVGSLAITGSAASAYASSTSTHTIFTTASTSTPSSKTNAAPIVGVRAAVALITTGLTAAFMVL
ncbi:hypothetical protein FRB90_006692 [Tulasnella sp. 427]|nr:hypothetical protein FRB90_006692 [Tulasnella sp. 427]